MKPPRIKPTTASRQFQPAVAQAKNRSDLKRPVAPAVYRPEAKQKVEQQKIAGAVQRKTSPIAPPVYRPQPAAKVLQQKSRVQPTAKQTDCKPVAPPVYRPQALPKVLQAKTAPGRKVDSSRSVPPATPTPNSKTPVKVIQGKKPAKLPSPAPPSRAPLTVAQSKNPRANAGREIQMARSNLPAISGSRVGTMKVIQRAELAPDEEKKVDPKYAVVLKAMLNGHPISAYVSKTPKYGEDSEHDHAEDGIIHAIEGVMWMLGSNGGEPPEGTSPANLKIAKALLFYNKSAKKLKLLKNDLRIHDLTASPCTSNSSIKKTSNKSKGEGCTEQLIELANNGLDIKLDDQILAAEFDITVEADHLYQPGDNAAERALSKLASAKACKKMMAAGIKVKITKP